MANPILPNWEYVPDGEPRVFGNRVYLYGSHDRAFSERFCDHKLKVWSASVDDLNNWICHGDAFHTVSDADHPADVSWCDGELYAPDVVEKDGKYYLFAYLFYDKGCIAVSDRPEGPFKLLSTYRISEREAALKDFCNNGVFVDPGVLVDDDGQVYIYCGYEYSYVAQLNPDNIAEVVEGTYQRDIIPTEAPFNFFEACSPRKIGDTYYLVYSPKKGNQLVYATGKSPTGPFNYRGVIVDNGIDYPAGNNHGSICKINDRWYIFYHRTSNNTLHSRQACVEEIQILKDGTILQAEMTSLGFEKALNPYAVTRGDIACVLKGGCYIKEKNPLTRVIAGILKDCVVGYKYFDFGQDYSLTSMECYIKIHGMGEVGKLRLVLDDPDNGKTIGETDFGGDDGILKINIKCVTGRHALYFIFDDVRRQDEYGFKGRELLRLESFVFVK